MKHLTETTIAVKSYIKKNLSEKRYAHSIGVGKYASFLASLSKKTKKLSKLAYFTGIAHDIAKELPDEQQLILAKKDGLGISDVEKQRVNLLHGRSGAVLIKEKFNVDDLEVLHAIMYHTFGSPELKQLGKIIFVADKIEPGRERYSKKFRKMALKLSLDDLTLAVLNWNIQYVIEKGGMVSPFSLDMKNILEKKNILKGGK